MASRPARFVVLRALALGSLIALGSLAISGPRSASAGEPGPTEPTANERETAKALMIEGDTFFDAKQWDKALEKYKAAHVLVNLPSTGIWVAKTLDKLGRLSEAREVALQASRLPTKPNERDVVVKARAEAGQLAAALAPRIPSLEVVVVGPAQGAYELTVDGKVIRPELLKVAQKVNPGMHKAAASTPGFKRGAGQTEVAEGALAKIVITLEKDSGAPVVGEPRPDPQTPKPDPVAPEQPAGGGGGTSPLVFAGFIGGGALLLVGAITGGVSFAKAKDLADACDNDKPGCDADAKEKANALAWVANITLPLGGVGVVLGVVGLFLPTGDEPAAKPAKVTIEPLIGPAYVGLRGTFY